MGVAWMMLFFSSMVRAIGSEPIAWPPIRFALTELTFGKLRKPYKVHKLLDVALYLLLNA
jgi:hypothetical protein